MRVKRVKWHSAHRFQHRWSFGRSSKRIDTSQCIDIRGRDNASNSSGTECRPEWGRGRLGSRARLQREQALDIKVLEHIASGRDRLAHANLLTQCLSYVLHGRETRGWINLEAGGGAGAARIRRTQVEHLAAVALPSERTHTLRHIGFGGGASAAVLTQIDTALVAFVRRIRGTNDQCEQLRGQVLRVAVVRYVLWHHVAHVLVGQVAVEVLAQYGEYGVLVDRGQVA